jgi:hypothetical protein
MQFRGALHFKKKELIIISRVVCERDRFCPGFLLAMGYNEYKKKKKNYDKKHTNKG